MVYSGYKTISSCVSAARFFGLIREGSLRRNRCVRRERDTER
nr:MAG TPA: hypothetical protein [Caudoviricetes sp.]